MRVFTGFLANSLCRVPTCHALADPWKQTLGSLAFLFLVLVLGGGGGLGGWELITLN
jgi:hypothetical protein